MGFPSIRVERPRELSQCRTSVWQLHEWYQNDNKNCYERSGKRSKSGKQEKKECKVEQRCQLRTCQWNINSMHQAAKHVFETLINVESDVIILNEFGSPFQEGISDLKRHLENAAYSVYVAPGTFPAAIASRLPVSDVKGFRLDEYRNAVGVSVTCTDGKIARVYGTHLKDSDSDDGRFRLSEVKALLQQIQADSMSLSPWKYTIIVGDLNQQRQRDYTAEEWQAICNNKAERASPRDDGVGNSLEEAGFFSTWDTAPRNGGEAFVNWTPTDPPPSTHWTGTIVDYSYGKGEGLGVRSLFVSPCTFSGHRLIVTDWKWPI